MALTLVLATAAQAQAAPRQGWAHLDKLADLQPQGLAPKVDPASYLQIQQAYARFGMAYDEGRGAVLASLFTEDAVVEVGDASAVPFERSVGRAAIVRQFAAAFTAQGDQRRHIVGNVLVERFTGEQADTLAYGVVTVANGAPQIGASVIYKARLLRGQDGVWRFATLFIGIDSYLGRKPKVTD